MSNQNADVSFTILKSDSYNNSFYSPFSLEVMVDLVRDTDTFDFEDIFPVYWQEQILDKKWENNQERNVCWFIWFKLNW